MAYQRFKPADDSTHPLIQWIWLKMKEERLTHERVAKMSGITTTTLRNWARGRSDPKLKDIESVIAALGFDLSVKKTVSGN